MEKKIYIVRHCEAQGQSKEANLTEKGFDQAIYVADFFSNIKLDRIIASPFLRAIQSIEPLTKQAKIELETDDRLSERILSKTELPDWLGKLKETFSDMDLSFVGGESSNEAMGRAVNIVEDILKGNAENTLIVTHGNLMSLLIKKYRSDFGFDCWLKLSNPDVYLLRLKNNQPTIQRIWK